jgi:hypothetical protein
LSMGTWDLAFFLCLAKNIQSAPWPFCGTSF